MCYGLSQSHSSFALSNTLLPDARACLTPPFVHVVAKSGQRCNGCGEKARRSVKWNKADGDTYLPNLLLPVDVCAFAMRVVCYSRVNVQRIGTKYVCVLLTTGSFGLIVVVGVVVAFVYFFSHVRFFEFHVHLAPPLRCLRQPAMPQLEKALHGASGSAKHAPSYFTHTCP